MCIKTGTVSTDGFEMNYFCFGNGKKPLVIIPGLSIKNVTESADAVAAEYDIFTKDFTVYVLERRTDLPETYTVGRMASDTAEALGYLGLENIYMFGASQGGMIAMEIASSHPSLIAGLALGSTCAFVDKKRYSVIKEWITLAENGEKELLSLGFANRLYPENIYLQYKDVFVSQAEGITDSELQRFVTLARGTENFDIRDRLKNIQCPVLSLSSADDAVLGKDSASEIIESFKNRTNFRHFEYTGYGHASFDTAPDYREKLYGFFTSI